MFKSETISNAPNDRVDQGAACFAHFPLNFGFVSDFELRISDFPRRRGFSFTEIMFAVVILGIGFIMVAAIFPVALQQSKNTTEEINAAGIARGAAHYAGQIFSDRADPIPANPVVTNLPATGVTGYANRPMVQQIPVVLTPAAPTVPSAWDMLRGSMLMVEDPRYAYVMLYRRDGDLADNAHTDWAPYAQVYVFPVQVRNKEAFDTADTAMFNTATPYDVYPSANLMAHKVRVSVAVDEAGVSLIAFDKTAPRPLSDTIEPWGNIDAAWEGAFVVIADDKIKPPVANQGRMNGRIYKLGVRREDMDSNTTVFTNASTIVYELTPGNDFVPDPGADGIFGDPADLADVHHKDDITAVGQKCALPSTVDAAAAEAFVIGRGYKTPFNPLDPPPGFGGLAMPISVYTTFVKVK